MTEYERPLDFDDVLEDIPKEEFILLEPGEYSFKVTSFVKRRWDSGKLAGANYAEIGLDFDNGTLRSSGRENLTLHPKMLWKVREFFKAIGENVEDGKPFVPNWNAVLGSTGRCKVRQRSFKGREGEIVKTNEVEKFLPADPIDGDGVPF